MKKDKTRYFIYGSMDSNETRVVAIPDVSKSYFIKNLGSEGLSSELTKEEFENHLSKGAKKLKVRRQSKLGHWIRTNRGRLDGLANYMWYSTMIIIGGAFLYFAWNVFLGHNDINNIQIGTINFLIAFFFCMLFFCTLFTETVLTFFSGSRYGPAIWQKEFLTDDPLIKDEF